MPGPEENSYASKLAQQAQSKADLSYSYWAAGQAQGTSSVQEKKLTAEELEEQAKREKAANAKGVSVWNQAGTFEERDCTAYAKEELKRLMDNFQHESAAGCLQISELTSVEGEATVWLVRGSRRAGFDLTIEAAWTFSARGNDASAQGSLKVPGITPDDLDELGDMMEVTVKTTGSMQEPQLRKHVRGCAEVFAERLSKLHGLLKQR
ncbi:g5437 [Coccomyxa viridis]|uniref:G5437 protein n=1 Tax=Coccomyxa viridis TaxID=1274662 RepID=A0ABP1FSU7_9CHLO